MSDNNDACWYILDTRQVVGNCALWWRPDGQGYTCDLNDAGLYTKAEAFSHRGTDVPVHRDVARANAFTHVRVEGLWRDEDTGARLRNERDARLEDARRMSELSEVELEIALELSPFEGEGYDPCDVTVLRDGIVTATKEHTCHGCGTESIRKGLRHRCRVETSEDGLTSYRWCHDHMKAHMGYPYGEQRLSER